MRINKRILIEKKPIRVPVFVFPKMSRLARFFWINTILSVSLTETFVYIHSNHMKVGTFWTTNAEIGAFLFGLLALVAGVIYIMQEF